MLTLISEVDCSFDMDLLEEILKTQTTKEVELVLSDDENIRAYNHQYRGKDSPTDVLSFPCDVGYEMVEGMQIPLGCIVVSVDYVFRGASQYGHEPQDELALLFVHGLLHLMGHDHEVDEGQMRELEHGIVRQFNLPDSLIVRTV